MLDKIVYVNYPGKRKNTAMTAQEILQALSLKSVNVFRTNALRQNKDFCGYTVVQLDEELLRRRKNVSP